MPDEAHTLGFGVTYDMVAARTACGQLLTLTSHRRDHAIPPHKHANDYLCIVLTGGFAEQEGSRWHDRLRGSFFRHHAGEVHHDRFGPRGAICVNLHFGSEETGPAIDGACPLPMRVAAEQLAFELAASCRDELVLASLAAQIMGDAGTRKDDGGTWVSLIVEAISDEPHRRWTLRELAEVADRHPVHVAQAFRAKSGISLGAFQRLRRLTCLGLALRTARTPLAQLAVDFGYYDQAHMTAEFGRAFGVTPGRYRRDFH
jgi:AraC family transcriptional regulator